MHILFVTGEYPPMSGGVGAYTAALAQALVDIGIRVTVLTSRQAHTTLAQSDAITLYPTITRWDWRIWNAVPRLAQELGANWIHVQYQTAAFAMNPAINLAPGWWRRAANQSGHPCQVAWTYHDLLVPYLFPKAGTRLRRWITMQPAHNSQLVVATNEADRRQLAEQQSRAKVVKIPIGSNIAVHELSPEERRHARSQRGYQEQTLLVGYFGFLNRSKGGLTLIHTLHELVRLGYDAQLLMIGERVGASDPTNFAYLQEVEALIAQLDLTARVQWTGRLSDRAVSQALHLLDVLFMPYSDGISLRRGTLMAGLAHGCAIVTTAPVYPLPELVDGRDLLYVPPEDPQRAASVIASLANQPQLHQGLQRSARRQSNQFTWSTIATHHVQAYQTQQHHLATDVSNHE